jgi:hypothetical protein
VDHGVELVAGEELRGLVARGDVEEREAEFGVGLEAREACFLEAHVVVGVEVVDAEDRVAPAEEGGGDGGADEAGGAGDEEFHVVTSRLRAHNSAY